MKLAISRIHYPVTTLGPGRRVGIWFQGCSIRCPGCISTDTWQAAPGASSANELVEGIRPWLEECDGVTISGGEPFDQPLGLTSLLQAIKGEFDTNILVFSGYSFETLLESQRSWQGMIDALVTDPFVESAPQTKPLRGSDNQRLHCLTALGEALFSNYEHSSANVNKKLDVMFDEDGVVWLAGIPTRGDMTMLRTLLLEDGHSAYTTEAPIRDGRKRIN